MAFNQELFRKKTILDAWQGSKYKSTKLTLEKWPYMTSIIY